MFQTLNPKQFFSGSCRSMPMHSVGTHVTSMLAQREEHVYLAFLLMPCKAIALRLPCLSSAFADGGRREAQ